MLRCRLVLAGVVGLCCLASPPAGAQDILYNTTGGVQDLSNAWEMSGFREAQEFTLDHSGTLNEVAIPTTYQGGGVIDPNYGFRGFFQWTVFTDDGTNAPHTVVAQGTVVPTRESQSILAPDFDQSWWEFGVTPTSLTANTPYWLEILNTDSTGSLKDVGFYWLSATFFGHPDEPASMHWDPTTGTWMGNPIVDAAYLGYGNHLAMFLGGELNPVTTTPEPTSLALMVTGLGAIGVMRRRFRFRSPLG